MKTIIRLLTVLALALATFSLPTTAWAASVFNFKGQSADAFFSSTDPSGCIFTDVFLFASEQTFQNPPGPGIPSSGTGLFISQFDSCTGTQLLAADGFASLAGPDFQVNRTLNSATLNATVNVFDFVSGASFDVDVNLTWTGAGPLARQNGHFHFQSPGCISNGSFSGTFRSATASGSVSDGATNFTPAPSVFASIGSARSGSVTVGCGLG